MRITSRYLWWMSTRVISFFFTKFHSGNLDACRIFYEKPIFALMGKGPKMILELEKCDFSANMGIIRPISLIFPKKPIDTFSNLQIINIGRFGRFIQS